MLALCDVLDGCRREVVAPAVGERDGDVERLRVERVGLRVQRRRIVAASSSSHQQRVEVDALRRQDESRLHLRDDVQRRHAWIFSNVALSSSACIAT